jgi:hypothetical protein
VGRALALDPEQPEAIAVLTALAEVPPDDVPVEVRARIDARVAEVHGVSGRVRFRAYVTWLGMLPLLVWMGVRDARPIALMVAAVVAAGAAIRLTAGRPSRAGVGAALLTGLAAASLASALFGPFVLVPSIVVAVGIHNVAFVPARRRAVLVAAAVLAMVVPWLLEQRGVVPPSVRFVAGQILLAPRAVEFPPVASTVVLIVAHALVLLYAVLHVGRLQDSLARSERRLLEQAWHLGQMVPAVARQVAERA